MKKIIALLAVLLLLLSGCSQTGDAKAAIGVGRKIGSTQEAW